MPFWQETIKGLYEQVERKVKEAEALAAAGADAERAPERVRAVQQARSILDSIRYDGSWGVHNFKYTEALLLAGRQNGLSWGLVMHTQPSSRDGRNPVDPRDGGPSGRAVHCWGRRPAGESASPGFWVGRGRSWSRWGSKGPGYACRCPSPMRTSPRTSVGPLPVMGTPIKVKLERYLPDLKWETTATDDPNGGPVAKLSLRGENLQQDLWLGARDRERQSISAHIGSVAHPGASGAGRTTRSLQELTEPDTVGRAARLAFRDERSAGGTRSGRAGP